MANESSFIVSDVAFTQADANADPPPERDAHAGAYVYPLYPHRKENARPHAHAGARHHAEAHAARPRRSPHSDR